MHLVDDGLGYVTAGRDRPKIERACLEPMRADEVAPRRATLLDPLCERVIPTETGEVRSFVDEDEPA